MQALQN
ncbi:hypothetical protein YPPY36_3700, partial [Yersinia pestis PY-36]